MVASVHSHQQCRGFPPLLGLSSICCLQTCADVHSDWCGLVFVVTFIILPLIIRDPDHLVLWLFFFFSLSLKHVREIYLLQLAS